MAGMGYHEAADYLVANEPTFATATAEIRGVTYKVFKNAPPHLRALMQASRAQQGDGALEYLVYEGERWTYDEFCAEVNKMAHVLKDEFGIGKGGRVGIAMQNAPEIPILLMATQSIGGVAVLINAWWTTEELDYAVGLTDLKLVFADGERVRRLAPVAEKRGLEIIGARDGEAHAKKTYTALRDGAKNADWPDVEIDPDDDFAIMFSSGTTSNPKAVVLTHRGAINAVFTWLLQGVMIPMLNPPPEDAGEPLRLSALIITPLFHVTACHPMFLLSIPAGAKIAIMRKWDAEEAVRLIRDENITRFAGVPTQSADLMVAAKNMGEELPSLDFIGSGGAKRPAPQVGEIKKDFPRANPATGWGMTETNANGIGLTGEEYLANPGAAGRLYPPIQEIKFLDDDGNPVPTGSIGEITVKSPCNMRCYLNNEEATNEALRDGWLRTGDLGMIDANGIITILDRKKDIVIRGGENIACLDVEGALHRHPAIAEACAFSVPDDRLGEVVGAGVQLRAGASTTPEDIQSFLADHIAKFKIPEHIFIQPDPLPRGTTDKLDRRALRARCLEAMGKNA